MLTLGLDVGTSGLKALAIDAGDGAVVASATRDYPLATPKPRWAEQDPEDFARAAVAALADVAKALGPRANDVRAIGLTGQMHSAVLLDASRRVLRPAILWCDTRTTDECRAIERALGEDGLRRTVKNRALEGFTLPKLLWVRAHEPETFARVRHVLMPKDWVGLRLTGELGTDVSDASGTLAFDPEARAWSREAIEAVGLDPSIFPPAGESPSVLGTLRADVAAQTGLPVGVPVARGGADNAAGAVGLGVVRAGRAMVSIGTSGVVLVHTDALRVDRAMRLHSFCASVPGSAYLMGVMLAAGGALRWFRDVVARVPYDEITARAANSPIGARGIAFLPYLMGERTPHDDAAARGAFVGLTAAAGLDDLARAVLEGISFGLDDSLAIVRSLEPPLAVGPMQKAADPVTELRLTGGGAKSAVWRQILADVFDADVVTTTSTEGPAFGAATLAAVAMGAAASVEEAADRFVRIETRTAPRREAVERYREPLRIYRALYGDLKQRFAELGNV